ncbi:MAG: ABC transporter substrate-binding protein, partial [Mycobacteriales bacterium]
LPQTGGLSAYGPGMLAAVQLAVADINAAGGVNRVDVTLAEADDGTDPAVAQRAVRGLLGDSVNAIIGPGSSSVCKGVIDAVTSAGVLLFSPASTSDEFTSYNDRGLFFRTAPPDALQARLLANIIVQEGGRVVGLMYQNTTYGLGLATAIQQDLVASGEVAKDNIMPVRYDPASVDFSPYVKRLREKRPDFIVVIGYDESPRVVKALNRAGLGPKR